MNAPIAPRVRPQEPPQIAERRVTFADLRVTQPSLQRSYLVPSYTTAKDGEGEALDLLAYVIGSGSNSRLYRALVMDKKLATNVGAWYSGHVARQHALRLLRDARDGRCARKA